jgi:hypothetical protein
MIVPNHQPDYIFYNDVFFSTWIPRSLRHIKTGLTVRKQTVAPRDSNSEVRPRDPGCHVITHLVVLYTTPAGGHFANMYIYIYYIYMYMLHHVTVFQMAPCCN